MCVCVRFSIFWVSVCTYVYIYIYISVADAELLKAHFNSVQGAVDLVDRVFIAKVKRCFGKKQNKVHFAVCAELEPVLDALLRCMAKAGGKIKRGTAPRSGNEREMQELVDKLSKIVGEGVSPNGVMQSWRGARPVGRRLSAIGLRGSCFLRWRRAIRCRRASGGFLRFVAD